MPERSRPSGRPEAPRTFELKPAPDALWGRMRAFVEGIVVYAAMGVAGGALLVQHTFSPQWLVGLGAGLAVVYLFATLGIRREYLRTLVGGIREGRLDLDELKELSESNPVKKLLNLVLLQAIRDKASDIHFEPFEDEYKMRYRIDGVLYEMIPPPKYIAAALSSRIKVMANLDIAERRLPQDGRISLTVQSKPVDLRVSVLPTMFGESVVLRVLDRSQVTFDLAKLGLRDEDHKLVRQLIHKPNGIIIATGPTYLEPPRPCWLAAPAMTASMAAAIAAIFWAPFAVLRCLTYSSTWGSIFSCSMKPVLYLPE